MRSSTNDYMGNEIKIGYVVVFIAKYYKVLTLGIVKAISDSGKTIDIDYTRVGGSKGISHQKVSKVIMISDGKFDKEADADQMLRNMNIMKRLTKGNER